MGNSSLFDSRRKYFGGEDYWHGNTVRDYGVIHYTHHIPALYAIAENQEIVNNYYTLTFG